jgi:hypothetical protein
MNEQPEKMERQIDQELAQWAGRLDAEPASAVTARIRSAVRQELNEQWLAGQTSPGPSPAVLRGVRAAVAAELQRSDGDRVVAPAAQSARARSPRRKWDSPACGFSAAAAGLMLCLGVVRLAGEWVSAPQESATLLVRFVETAADRPLTDVSTEAIGREILGLERRLTDGPAEELEATTDALEELVREMDELLQESPAGRTSSIRAAQPGALG